MKKFLIAKIAKIAKLRFLIYCFYCLLFIGIFCIQPIERGFAMTMTTTKLSEPKSVNAKSMPLNQAIAARRSVRDFSAKEITPEQISELLWAAQGITEPKRGLRAAPSAGALYPLDLYIVKADGIWQYLPHQHSLKTVREGNFREQLAAAALNQGAVKEAPLCVVITATYSRTTVKYGERGIMYTHFEAGHVAQNLALEAVALGLDSVPVGAFNPKTVNQLLNLSSEQTSLYIIPIGYRG